MSKLRKDFSKKQWEKCCTGMCGDCKIAQSYIEKFGKKTAEKKIERDKEKALA